jgi:osmoprotectant transport system substrate-binding protein
MRKCMVLVLMLALVASGFAFAGGGQEKSVSVGAKNFTEQYIMGEILSMMLEAEGFSVQQDFGMSSTAVRSGLETGQIDLYADYTGTAWVTYLDHEDVISDPDELYQRVKQEDMEKNNIAWVSMLPVNNTYALAVKEEFAEEHDLQTLSDLAELVQQNPGEYQIAVDYEFFERPDGFFAMAETYNMDVPRSQVRAMEIGLTYEAINQGSVDVAMVFATDGRLRRFNMTVLDDDKNFFPPYNLGVCVRQEVLDEYPAIETVFDPLADVLNQDVMIELNYRVDAEEQEPEQVAESFLQEHGLIE